MANLATGSDPYLDERSVIRRRQASRESVTDLVTTRTGRYCVLCEEGRGTAFRNSPSTPIRNVIAQPGT